jgi:hypothetical protein
MNHYDWLLTIATACAIAVLAYDLMVSVATVVVEWQVDHGVGLFGVLDKIGAILDPIVVFLRQASVSALVLAIVALLKLLEVHP